MILSQSGGRLFLLPFINSCPFKLKLSDKDILDLDLLQCSIKLIIGLDWMRAHSQDLSMCLTIYHRQTLFDFLNTYKFLFR